MTKRLGRLIHVGLGTTSGRFERIRGEQYRRMKFNEMVA